MITPSTTRNTASPKSLNPRIAQVSAGNDAACTALRTAASKAAAAPCITALASHTKRISAASATTRSPETFTGISPGFRFFIQFYFTIQVLYNSGALQFRQGLGAI